MAASVVDLPAPEGPNSTVIPGGARKDTSSVKASDFTVMSTLSSLTAHQAVHAVKTQDSDARENQHHGHGIGFAVRLNRVVDGQRRGLRLAGDVARDHQRDAEVAERARERQRHPGEEAAG